MESCSQNDIGNISEQIGELTPKQRVLMVYPEAQCVFKYTNIEGVGIKYCIVNENKILGSSFTSENLAWDWAITVINRKMIEKLGE